MKKISLISLAILLVLVVKSQITVSGFIYDAETKESIIGANIIDTLNSTGTSSNTQGYYVIKTDSKEILVSFMGYKTNTLLLSPKKDTIINIYLKPSNYKLKEFTVSARSSNSINVARLDIKTIVELPALGGQVDVLKSTQILPGIQAQSEASSLLIVRGGDPGQNMFLLDNTSLIYVNHLGGFMSVFNPDIINDIQIYKGGFPAKYGGKLSSIIDITQRSGNSNEFKGSFGIGVTDANISLEGKINNKLTYIFTARKTLFDILFLAATSIGEGNEFFMMYGFHDVNFKTVWRANDRNTFAFNVFQGDDYMNVWNKPNKYGQLKAKTRLTKIWGNLMTSASWNCILNPKTFGKTNVSYSRYRLSDIQSFSNDANNQYFNNNFTSKVEDVSFNSVWTRSILKKWMLIGGVHLNYLHNTPYDYKISGIASSHKVLSEELVNSAFSVSNKIQINNFIDANIGARFSNYSLSDDSEFFVEPRLDVNLKLNKFGIFNFNYMQVNQASHLLVATGNISANEIWIPASKAVPISNSKQASIAWTKNLSSNMYKISVGVYHKELSNLVTSQKNVTDLIELENWKQSVEIGGTGKVNGLEFMITKNYGDWTGSLSYHLSNAKREFDNINNGKEYTFEYNRPHDFTIFINRKLTDKLSFSIVWNYQTGLPYTPVLGRHTTIDPITSEYYEALIYSERNSSTMKAYHRLDLGVKYETVSKKRKLKTVWTFSIYNAYNRQNPSYYYYNNNSGEIIHSPQNGFAKLNLYQMSLFPILPSVSYKVYFGKRDKTKKKQRVSFKNWLNYEK